MKLSTSLLIVALASLQGFVFAAPPGLSTLPKPIKNPGTDLLSQLKFRRQVDLALGEDAVDPTPAALPVETPAEATPNVPSDVPISAEAVEVAHALKKISALPGLEALAVVLRLLFGQLPVGGGLPLRQN
ncbi:hypothetical protein MD484_g467, partial [Candolleomyces efflorescens]